MYYLRLDRLAERRIGCLFTQTLALRLTWIGLEGQMHRAQSELQILRQDINDHRITDDYIESIEQKAQRRNQTIDHIISQLQSVINQQKIVAKSQQYSEQLEQAEKEHRKIWFANQLELKKQREHESSTVRELRPGANWPFLWARRPWCSSLWNFWYSRWLGEESTGELPAGDFGGGIARRPELADIVERRNFLAQRRPYWPSWWPSLWTSPWIGDGISGEQPAGDFGGGIARRFNFELEDGAERRVQEGLAGEHGDKKNNF